MILDPKELQKMPEFGMMTKKEIKKKLIAIEKLIRAHTNNNFQNRKVRFRAAACGRCVCGNSLLLKAGDTVQISESPNEGLYVIKQKNLKCIELDKRLHDCPHNLVTKVEYPEDVKQGVINLMKWEQENRSKVGIKSETISRRSVTYFDQDSNNQVMGYPVSLMGFLKPYMKARF